MKTGKITAAALGWRHMEVQNMESDLKAAKEELKIACKEQLKAEKATAIKRIIPAVHS